MPDEGKPGRSRGLLATCCGRGLCPQIAARTGEGRGPERILIVAGHDRVRLVISRMVAEEGRRSGRGDWHHLGLLRTISEGFRMAVLDQGAARALVSYLVRGIYFDQCKEPVTVPVPCWSHFEIGGRTVADFSCVEPFNVAQIRSVPARACSSWTTGVGNLRRMPAATA